MYLIVRLKRPLAGGHDHIHTDRLTHQNLLPTPLIIHINNRTTYRLYNASIRDDIEGYTDIWDRKAGYQASENQLLLCGMSSASLVHSRVDVADDQTKVEMFSRMALHIMYVPLLIQLILGEKRGCAAICPDGEMKTGKNRR